MTSVDPRQAVDALAASREPYLLGVRHHSPALAAVVPRLLEDAGAEVVCVELPADFQPWLEHLADPETVAPVALAGAGEAGRLAFYPFADFSPELVAVRWARERGVEVVCCDLPLSDPGWSPASTARQRGEEADDRAGDGEAGLGTDQGADSVAGGAGSAGGALSAEPTATPSGVLPTGPDAGETRGRASFAGALAAAGTGREGEDMWDRAVEVLAPGCSPEAVRRAALGVGWALRADGAVPATDLAREARMRQVIATASAGGRRVAAVIGAFHAPALLADSGTDYDAGVDTGTRDQVPAYEGPAGAGPAAVPAQAGPDAAGSSAAGRPAHRASAG
ncbi:DUF5682 family protein, partial [Streptomyces sp. NPDC006464]|uniref:DUF5682 family protein n=1 Tax=Streptomyces sp. NPDC006464 TaxID=3154305 RepID=UPI0033B92A8E